MESLIEKYTMFAQQLKIEDIPNEVQERVKYFILDTLGVGIAGSRSDAATIVRKFVASQVLPQEASIWGTPEKSSTYGAALVNGTSSHAHDYDDTHNWAEIHISAVLVPCLLALGEKLKINGRKIIEAYTAAYEVTARIGVITNAGILYRKGFHPTGVVGPFGVALATGLIMNLNKQEMVNALGIAGSFSSGLFEFMYDGSMTKRFHPGLASWHGIMASVLAQGGFTGPRKILEGEKGCLNAFTGDFGRTDLATKGLGTYFEILENHTKIYACVSGFSAPIECLITIMKEHQISPQQIEHVDVGVRDLTYLCSKPPEEKPTNILSAQMSLPYCLAAAAYDKDVKLAQFSNEKLKDPNILSFMRRITLSPRKDLTELNKRDTVCLPGRVSVKTKDGQEYTHQLEYAKDSRGNRASREELQGKFFELSRPIIGDNQSERIVSMINKMEALDDVGELATLCQAVT